MIPLNKREREAAAMIDLAALAFTLFLVLATVLALVVEAAV
jgi:hypothetical protein